MIALPVAAFAAIAYLAWASLAPAVKEGLSGLTNILRRRGGAGGGYGLLGGSGGAGGAGAGGAGSHGVSGADVVLKMSPAGNASAGDVFPRCVGSVGRDCWAVRGRVQYVCACVCACACACAVCMCVCACVWRVQHDAFNRGSCWEVMPWVAAALVAAVRLQPAAPPPPPPRATPPSPQILHGRRAGRRLRLCGAGHNHHHPHGALRGGRKGVRGCAARPVQAPALSRTIPHRITRCLGPRPTLPHAHQNTHAAAPS